MHVTTTTPGGPPGPDRTREYLAYADRVWRGEEDLTAHLDGRYAGDRLVRVGDGVGMYPGFANSAVFDTGSGLVMVDSGDAITAAVRHAAVRAFSRSRCAPSCSRTGTSTTWAVPARSTRRRRRRR